MRNFDVTVVLNMHREALLLRPTLVSLSDCAVFAGEAGLKVQLVAVFDRSDQATRRVFDSEDLRGFSDIRKVEVDVGSLGLARNAGVELAEGEYIWTCDADDLVSSDCLTALHRTANSHPGGNVAVFVEYLCAFGQQYHNARYVDGKWLVPGDFALQHPYVSRIFLPRKAFDSIRYRDLRVTSGFAYEDWDFNCRLLALGYEFLTAKGTAFFYRQRSGSLLRQANSSSAKLIPHSDLFEPSTFIEQMQDRRIEVGDWQNFLLERRRIFDQDNTQSLASDELLLDHLRHAACLEPEIEPDRILTAPSYTSIPWKSNHWGLQLESFFKLAGQEKFTDILLVPWLRPGGAEKYILSILQELGEDSRTLVISGQTSASHNWMVKMPYNAVFVDVYNAFPTLDEDEMDSMLIRAILALNAGNARLHIKSSPFAHRILDKYASVLANDFRIVYYRFSDSRSTWRGQVLRGPWGLQVLRNHLNAFWKVISDCDAIRNDDRKVLGDSVEKYETIYALCQSSARFERPIGGIVRLLWASRIAPEKRPELIAPIVAKARDRGLNLEVEVFGTPDPGMDPSALFPGSAEGVRYMGSFDKFEDLPSSRYSALLYTSRFDGMPNVILEAMGVGLPVMAPEVGGIGECVQTGHTGWLIAEQSDDLMIDAYVDAVQDLVENPSNAQELANNGRFLISTRHAKAPFMGRVRQVLNAVSE